MKVNVYIDHNGSIFLRCYPRPMDLCEFYINEVINPKNFSKKREVLSSEPRANVINKKVRDITDFIHATVDNGRSMGMIITGGELKKLLIQRYRTGEVKEAEYTFNSFTEYWLSTLNIEPRTLAGYRAKIRCVTLFYPDITFDDITIKWRMDSEKRFREGEWFDINGKKEWKQYGTNQISSIYKRLKEMISLACDMGVTSIDAIKNKRWHVSAVEADNIYLDENEIDMLYNYPFDQRLRNAVDNLVLSCDIGWRYSDYSRIEEKTIIHRGDTEFLRIKTSKSGDKPIWATIAVTPRVKEILSRVRHISDDKLRKYYKEAAKLAGLEKWEKIGTHTGRRSFATNSYLNGKPMPYIMAACGWKTEKQAMQYIKVVDFKIAIDHAKSS